MTGRSIRLRLTLWYAGTILVLLLAMAAGARALVRDSLEQEFARSQETTVALVRGFFRVEIAEYRQIVPTLDHISGELVIPDRHVEFVRPDGARHRPGPSVRVMPLPALAAPTRELVAPLDPDLAPGWSLRIRSSAAPLVRQQRQVDRWALLAVPVAFALAVLGGWVLTGRTLRPVAEMAAAADRIGAGGGSRLPIAVPGDELGRLGARFNALLDRLDEALARQRRFLADAAHELRTPIARARGVGELALTSADLPEAGRAALGRTQHELEMMSHLVDELLELARTEAASAPPPAATVYLDDLAAESARAFAAVAARRAMRIELDLPEEVPVQGDAAALGRLLGVLVDNALQYSEPCGVVHVAARRRDGHAELEVRDAGIGIPPEERARLFERFFRGAKARQAAPDGSGLGLAIAQAIAVRHGARILIEAAEPKGTRVIVRFAA